MYSRVSKLSFLVILSIWSVLSGCVTPSHSGLKDAAARQSFLWEARKGDETLTLVGTMHIGITPDDMDPKLWNRLASADTVIIETDLSDYNPQLMQRYLILPHGHDLSQLLGAKSWAKFSEIIAKAGNAMPERQLKQMTPLAAGALLLQVQARADQDIEEGRLSIDQIIYDRAKSQGKKALTLETNAEQMGYLESVFTIDALQKMLSEWDDESTNYADMKNAFKNGDSKELDTMLEEIPAEMRGVLLDKRNQNWIRELPTLASKKHTLIAVGAAHYAGKNGLLNLLKAQGYTIRPIRP